MYCFLHVFYIDVGQYGRPEMKMKMWENARKFPETSQELADEEQTKVILATQREDWENENRSLVTEKENKILEWQLELKKRIAAENIEVDQRIRVNKRKIAKTIVYEKKAIDIKIQRLKYVNDFVRNSHYVFMLLRVYIIVCVCVCACAYIWVLVIGY